MRFPFVCLFALSVLGCKGSAQMSASTTPPPAPAPDPAPPAAADPAPDPEPETEPVVAVEPKKIEIQKNVIRLKPGIRILFGTDSADLQAASNDILDEVASVMTQNAKIRIRVEGHTDDAGKADHNMDLSTRRAASVKTYLASKGIAEDRLESQGCGQAVPIADNKTEDGKAQNRRVEFVIMRKRRVAAPCQVYKPREHHRKGADAAAPATP